MPWSAYRHIRYSAGVPSEVARRTIPIPVTHSFKIAETDTNYFREAPLCQYKIVDNVFLSNDIPTSSDDRGLLSSD